MSSSALVSAFLTGLLGASHCLAMCGGIACLLGTRSSKHSTRSAAISALLFNTGRVTSYALAGFVVAGSLSQIARVADSTKMLMALHWIAALMMILLGIHLMRFWSVLAPLERAGQLLWRPIQPHASRMLGSQSTWSALPLGMLWGWLPCGLVYSTLTLAAAQTNAAKGALVMACFGAGTFTIMCFAVMFGSKIQAFAKHRALQIISGLLVVSLGVNQLVKLF